MALGSLAGKACELGSTVADSGCDATPVEPLCTLHDGIEVEVLRQSLGDAAVSTVVDDLRRTHRSTRLSIVEAYTVATTCHKVGVHTIAAQGIHSNLADLVLGQLAYEVGVVAIIGQADSHIGLTTTGDDAE